jgi:hypothetical protein
MAVTTWNVAVIDGRRYLVIDVAKFRIPLDFDPSSNCFIAVAAPDGGLGNIPALLAGEPGATPELDTVIDFTAIPYGDATAEFASWTETSPNVYKLSLGLRNGQKGDDGDVVLDPADYGDPAFGRLLRVKADLSGFELIAPKNGGRAAYPASVAAVPSGNPSYTLCQIGFDAQPFDWWPEITGMTVMTGTGANVAVNLVARLGTTGISTPETTGPIVAQGFGVSGAGPTPLPLFSAGPPGSSTTYDKVLAGNTATLYVRTERRAGSDTYTTDAALSAFKGWVHPIP